MSNRDWKLFVEDILESLSLIEEYARNMEFEDFKKDRKTIDAIVRNLEIIGEASKFIPGSVKDKFSYVDWKAIVGLRNRIAHDYFGLSLSIIWEIIKKELPILKEQMKNIAESD
ncbi:MAG: DUF86 domain-containing protein [Acidobacteriota bacterium]